MKNKGNTAKTKAAQKKAPRKSQKPKLSASQKARLRQIEKDAVTNITAVTRLLEELTDDCFLRTAIDNEIVAQCKHYGITPVKYRDDRTQFLSAVKAIFNFGPIVDEFRSAEVGPPSIGRIPHDELNAIADRIGGVIDDDREIVLLVCGLLEYFSKMTNSAEANHLEDDIYAVANRLFRVSLHGDDAADKFIAQAYDSLRSNLKTPEAV